MRVQPVPKIRSCSRNVRVTSLDAAVAIHIVGSPSVLCNIWPCSDRQRTVSLAAVRKILRRWKVLARTKRGARGLDAGLLGTSQRGRRWSLFRYGLSSARSNALRGAWDRALSGALGIACDGARFRCHVESSREDIRRSGLRVQPRAMRRLKKVRRKNQRTSRSEKEMRAKMAKMVFEEFDQRSRESKRAKSFADVVPDDAEWSGKSGGWGTATTHLTGQ